MAAGHRLASLFTSCHYPVNVLDVVTANEFQKSPGEYLDRALRRPLTLTKHGRPHLVLIAADEYSPLIKLSEQTPTRADAASAR